MTTGAATPLDLVGGGIHCREEVFSTGAFNRFDCKFSIFCDVLLSGCFVRICLEKNSFLSFLNISGPSSLVMATSVQIKERMDFWAHLLES